MPAPQPSQPDATAPHSTAAAPRGYTGNRRTGPTPVLSLRRLQQAVSRPQEASRG